ncbi:hypothetical protein LC040_06130 [Bacillus tianshenii]|nr:hypothetical protein LC040_06130 [Bacillus tianshenii]
MDHQNGVTIGFREIYDEMRGMTQTLNRLDQRISKLEEKTSIAKEADERSREALEMANEACAKAEEAAQIVADTEKERKQNRKWIIGLTVTAASPWLFQLLAALNKFLSGGY